MLARLSFHNRIWLSALLSLLAVIAIALLLPANLYLSSHEWDLGEFAALRGFAADSIRAGHFPLWNPYVYAGEPLLGDFQSAELYPPNVIFLFLPLVRAINLSFLLHLLILAWGVGLWSARRGYHPGAAALAGLTAALSGPVFLRLANGQLAYLIGAAWAPWILCGVEAAWRGPAKKPLLLTMAAVALQILGGHPQYVFYVAIAAGLHAMIQTILNPSLRWRALPMVALVYFGGATLAAAQLLPGWAATAESVRQGRLDYAFVRLSSFPPENLLTLIAPRFFGDFTSVPYWGRYFLWEMCLYVGVSGVALVLLSIGDQKNRRRARADLFLAGILFVLALGDHTPLLRILYEHVLFFDKFRSLSKFTFPAMLFGVMALAAGADAVIHARVGRKIFAQCLVVAGLAAGISGIYLLLNHTSLAGLFSFLQQTHESGALDSLLAEPQFPRNATDQAGLSLAVGGLLLGVIGAAWLWSRRRPSWRLLPLFLQPVELVFFVLANLITTHPGDLAPAEMKAILAANPGDYRIMNPIGMNEGYLVGVPDIWGDNPSVLKRYAEFMTFIQGGDPDKANQSLEHFNLTPVLSLLRLRFGFIIQNQHLRLYEYHNSLPHVLLFANYQVMPGRDAIFAELGKLDINPYKTVFLESEPSPRPVPAAATGTAKLTDSTSDSLTIEADTPASAILLITDLYSRDWRARALPGSVQEHYDILPGDYILRAIPLAAGHHRLIVEYAPPSWYTGLIISAIAWVIWCALMIKMNPWGARKPIV